MEVDQGFHNHHTHTFRMWGVNCPEHRVAIMDKYLAAVNFTKNWFAEVPQEDWPFYVISKGPETFDSFDRFVARILRHHDDRDLSADLLSSNNAVPFMRDK